MCVILPSSYHMSAACFLTFCSVHGVHDQLFTESLHFDVKYFNVETFLCLIVIMRWLSNSVWRR